MEEIIFDQAEDWENRILCSDESCIGVIGPDGKCKECGKAYEDKLTAPASAGEIAIASDLEKTSAIETKQDKDAADSSGETNTAEDWENRILCSDESCIGVIGPDGKCKECGQPRKE